MNIRNITFALSTLAVAGIGVEAVAQQKPAGAARASNASSVVVYKSPT